jgi:hypothetical protein
MGELFWYVQEKERWPERNLNTSIAGLIIGARSNDLELSVTDEGKKG